MMRLIKSFVWPALAMLVFFAGWLIGYYTAYNRGKNMGYVESYQYVASAAKEHLEARDRYFEASNKLWAALMDLMEYKIKLQEEEGGK